MAFINQRSEQAVFVFSLFSDGKSLSLSLTVITTVSSIPLLGEADRTVQFPKVKAANMASFRTADAFLGRFFTYVTDFSILFHNCFQHNLECHSNQPVVSLASCTDNPVSFFLRNEET